MSAPEPIGYMTPEAIAGLRDGTSGSEVVVRSAFEGYSVPVTLVAQVVALRLGFAALMMGYIVERGISRSPPAWVTWAEAQGPGMATALAGSGTDDMEPFVDAAIAALASPPPSPAAREAAALTHADIDAICARPSVPSAGATTAGQYDRDTARLLYRKFCAANGLTAPKE